MNPLDATAAERALDAAPSWDATRRREAVEWFRKLDMPTQVDEVWRYINLDFDLRDLTLADGGRDPVPEGAVLAAVAERAGTLRVVDGAVIDGAGAADGLPAGIDFGSLADAVTAGGEAVQRALAAAVSPSVDIFAAAQGAFGTDGAFLHVPAGRVVEEPFVVDVTASGNGTVSFPMIVVDAGASAQASVVVRYASPDGETCVVAPQTVVVAGANANVALTVVQTWGDRTVAIGHQRIVAARDATVRFAEAGLGGRLSRLHLTVDLEGTGSNAEVVGVSFGHRDQTLDYRYFMHHAGTNTSSDMFLKGAVEDDALSVFTGMIRIDETAQRTDAFQTNRNLILSDGAAAQSVPNLEILANDVRCGHGSTVGPLDPEQRYYLMSRGLDRERADRLQVHGFFTEALMRFPEAAVTEPIATAITRKYTEALEEGRLS